MPAANIIENKDSFELEIAAPGMNKKDFKINLDNNILTILSERESKKEEKSEKNEDNVSYTRREFIYSSFNRSFTLPKSIELDKIKADYKNGILNISLPKKDEEKLNVKKEILVS
ncbi:MAG: Hsp20/alpha crystallin family protein [Bacteroidetes bacterium]|nr:Hsp20/alpha crystallin family protein [Bacteroidota bacterium]